MKLYQYLTVVLIIPMAAFVFINCGSSSTTSDAVSVTIKGSNAQVTSTSSVSASPLSTLDSGIDPTSVSIKVFKVAISENSDCSSLTTILEPATPEYVDFSSTPTIGEGSAAEGSYPCVVIEMSDQVKFVPAASSDSGSCVEGTEYTIDVCGEGFASSTLIDGSSVTCTADSDDTVAVYLSTLSVALPREPGSDTPETGNPLIAPTEATTGDGFKLENAFTVSAGGTGTFFADFTERVSDDFGECGVESPNWGFE